MNNAGDVDMALNTENGIVETIERTLKVTSVCIDKYEMDQWRNVFKKAIQKNGHNIVMKYSS